MDVVAKDPFPIRSSKQIWYQNGAILGWKKVTSTAPDKLTCGDVTGK